MQMEFYPFSKIEFRPVYPDKALALHKGKFLKGLVTFLKGATGLHKP